MKIKASEMEKIFQLSANGVKLYERQGIISPERGGNDYRSYSERELMAMGFSAQLRRFGLSLPETAQALNGSEEDYENALKNRAQILEEEIEERLRQRKTLRETIQKHELARSLLGRCEIGLTPATYFLGLRRGDAWLSPEAISLGSQWISTYSPHTFGAILLDGPYLTEGVNRPPQYGIGVPGGIALDKGLLPSPLVTYMLPKPCVMTALRLDYGREDLSEVYRLVTSYAAKEHFPLQGGGAIHVTGCRRTGDALSCLCLLYAPGLAESHAFGQLL